MKRDFRYAVRMLARSPLFTTVTAATLALGIGGAVSVFTVLNAVNLRALPIPDPQQLHVARKSTPGGGATRFSWPLFEQARAALQERADLFAATSATGMQVRIPGQTGASASERGLVQLVSGEFFEVLRQRPQRGRLIGSPDNQSGAGRPVAVISYGVTRRVPELGVRMALGANRANVAWLVVREALTLVLIGGALGIPLSLVAGRSVASFLYGIGAADPAAYGVGAALLFIVASAAAYIPAYRASRIDPVAALRGE